MISYEEAKTAREQYIFQTNKQTKGTRAMNRSTGEIITDKWQIMYLKAASHLYDFTESMQRKYSGIVWDCPDESAPNSEQWRESFVKDLQACLNPIVEAGYCNTGATTTTRSQNLETFPYLSDFLENLESDQRRFKDGAKNLLKYVAASKRKVITHSRKVGDMFFLDTRSMQFRENLAFQAIKPVVARKKVKTMTEGEREDFALDLISVYLATETDDEFKERSNKEASNMAYVANFVNTGKEITGTGRKSLARIARILIAATNLSFEGHTNYLREFIKKAGIVQALDELKSSQKYHTKCENAMKAPRGRKVTDGEIWKITANLLLTDHPEWWNRAEHLLNQERKRKFACCGIEKSVIINAVAGTLGFTVSTEPSEKDSRKLNLTIYDPRDNRGEYS